jgi:P4 family phage/plasmid primase-like protien
MRKPSSTGSLNKTKKPATDERTNMINTTDIDAATQFLHLLAPDATEHTFQVFPDLENAEALSKWQHGALTKLWPWLEQCNNQGCGVSFMVGQGDGKGRKAKNVIGVRALFADLDGPPLEVLADLGPTVIVESSPSHYHAYWKVSDCGLSAFTPLQKQLAAKLMSDPKVADLSHVMRLPGLCHVKSEPWLVRVVPGGSGKTYSVKELEALLGLQAPQPSATVEEQPVPSTAASSKTPFEQSVPEGERNDAIFRYACRLRAKGVTKPEAQALVLDAAAKCSPPLGMTEAINCLDSAWSYGKKPQPTTDLGNARRLVHLNAKNFRFLPEANKWLHWKGPRWERDTDGAINRAAKETIELIFAEANTAKEAGDVDLAKALHKHAHASQSAGRIQATIKLAQSEQGVPIMAEALDRDLYLLGVRNGVIDLKTGELQQAKREHYMTKLAPVDFDPSAMCPTWDAFLHRVMGENKELVGFLQRAVGYSLTGSTNEQCLFILIGEGSNGKSTFLNTLRECLGDYAVQSPASALMVKSTSGIPNDIARLRGTRFVATSEVEQGQRFAEALVKQLTGGDTMAARFLFQEYFEFVPSFKIWLAANHKPVIKGDDYAMWRRIRLVPFKVIIPPEQQDKELPKKLRAELPGILNWAVKGSLLWQANGLASPEAAIEATKAYQSEMDELGQWMSECCVHEPSASGKASVLLTSYQGWAEQNGATPLNATTFGTKLSARGFLKTKKESGFFYTGIGLAAPTQTLPSLHSLHSSSGTVSSISKLASKL